MSPLLLQIDPHPPELPGGYGMALLQTLLALAFVCVLAWVLLRAVAQRGFGARANGGRIQVLERVHLDAKRTLWLLKVGEKVLLIGAGDNASPTLLAEFGEGEVPDIHSSSSFAEIWKRTGAGAGTGTGTGAGTGTGSGQGSGQGRGPGPG